MSNMCRAVSARERVFIRTPAKMKGAVSAVFPTIETINTKLKRGVFCLATGAVAEAITRRTFSVLGRRKLGFGIVAVATGRGLYFYSGARYGPRGYL